MENLDLKLDPNNVIEIGEDEFKSFEKQINNDCNVIVTHLPLKLLKNSMKRI